MSSHLAHCQPSLNEEIHCMQSNYRRIDAQRFFWSASKWKFFTPFLKSLKFCVNCINLQNFEVSKLQRSSKSISVGPTLWG